MTIRSGWLFGPPYRKKRQAGNASWQPLPGLDWNQQWNPGCQIFRHNLANNIWKVSEIRVVPTYLKRRQQAIQEVAQNVSPWFCSFGRQHLPESSPTGRYVAQSGNPGWTIHAFERSQCDISCTFQFQFSLIHTVNITKTKSRNWSYFRWRICLVISSDILGLLLTQSQLALLVFFLRGACANLSSWAPNDKIIAFFSNQPNQASFLPRREYAHVQTAMTDRWQSQLSPKQKKRVICIAAYMFSVSSVLEWLYAILIPDNCANFFRSRGT